MGYPQRLLDDDEDVVLDLHPHWRALLLPALAVPIVIGVTVFLGTLADGSAATPVRLSLLGVAVVVLLVVSVRPWLRWLTTHYVVTTRRVAVREGALARSGRDIPLSRVNDVTFDHSLVERLFRSGTLTIESAGERGQVVLRDVPAVEEVQRTVYRLVEVSDERAHALGAGH